MKKILSVILIVLMLTSCMGQKEKFGHELDDTYKYLTENALIEWLPGTWELENNNSGEKRTLVFLPDGTFYAVENGEAGYARKWQVIKGIFSVDLRYPGGSKNWYGREYLYKKWAITDEKTIEMTYEEAREELPARLVRVSDDTSVGNSLGSLEDAIELKRKETASSQSGSNTGSKPAITATKPAIGMTKAEVEAVWGRPKDINTTTTVYGTREQWCYYRNKKMKYVYFTDGICDAIQE